MTLSFERPRLWAKYLAATLLIACVLLPALAIGALAGLFIEGLRVGFGLVGDLVDWWVEMGESS